MLQEREGSNGDVSDPRADPDPLNRVRPRGTRIPEGARRHEKVLKDIVHL